MKRKFKLGDIILNPLFPNDEILIYSIEYFGYRGECITGEYDGEKMWLIIDFGCEEIYTKIGNIFEDKRYEKKKSNSN
jgi:hypothetical protein